MFPRLGRRLAVGIVAVLACALAGPGAAAAAGGSYTQILCADPESGAGVVPDGQLPDGLTNPGHFAVMMNSSTLARCSGGTGIPLPTAADTRTPNAGGALVYRAGEGLRFRRATLYRRYLDHGNWSLFVHRASDWASPYASPFDERCDFHGCTARGAGDGMISGNRMDVAAGSEQTNGFSFSVLCEIPDGSWHCGPDGSRGLRLFGGRVTLEDPTNPQPSGAPSGSLITNTVLRGVEDLAVNATDSGSGVYRVRLLVDGDPRWSRVVDANHGRCADAAPANADAYEFVYRRPCKESAGGDFAVDTTELPEGPAHVVVQVEDASGNATTLRNARVTVDNVPAPAVVAAPAVSGTARRGSSLAVSPGSWDDHGATSALSVSRVWQRCGRDGSVCADVPGAVGPTYEVGSDDLNRRLRVVETAANGEGATSAASDLSAVVTREDGTLPPDNDGVDNDGDGQVDEPGEADTDSGGGSTATPSGGSTGTVSGGSTALRPSAPSSRVVLADGAANGQGASSDAKLTVRFAGGGAARTVAFGRSSIAEGRLVDGEGRPIRDAIVDVAGTPARRGARAASLAPAVTGADGAFRYALTGRGPSRAVRFEYRHVRGGAVTSSAALSLTVRAGVSLRVGLRGTAVNYRGRVVASSLPRTGKLIVVQGRSAGGSWQTFASRRAGAGKGTFTGRYRLKVRRPGTRLQFRAKVVGEAGWPYAANTSKVITKRVR